VAAGCDTLWSNPHEFAAPEGPALGVVGEILLFQTRGAACSPDHEVRILLGRGGRVAWSGTGTGRELQT